MFFLLSMLLLGAAGAQQLVTNKAATYWMTVGETVRPGVPLDVNVQILAGQNSVDISFNLLNSAGNRTLFQAPIQTVLPGAVQKLTIDIPEDIEKPTYELYAQQRYKLRVSGRGQDVNFKNESSLNYDPKNFSIFIQTDKAIYKPSHEVKIRVLAMTSDQKVFPTTMDILIRDPRENRIWQKLGVTSEEGNVVELSFPLAAQVPLGDWSILVIIKGVEESIPFTVSDYVLPKFEVEVDAPPFGVISEPLLKITVRAKYTFGQPVTKGRASVKIRMLYYYGTIDDFIYREGEVNAEGEFSFDVTTTNLLDHVNALEKQYGPYESSSLSYRSFSIEANVTEHSTGRVQGGSTSIQYYETPMKITFMPISPTNFKPGLNYTAYVEVTKQDGSLFSPSEASKIKLNFSVYHIAPRQELPPTATLEDSKALTQPEWVHFNLEDRILPESGWIPLTFRVPDTADTISVRAYCKEPYTSVWDMHRAYRALSPSMSYLQMTVPVERPKVGDIIEVTAAATDELTQLHFQVYSKGMLVSSYDVPGSGQTAKLDLQLTHEMAPSMQLMAFYVRPENNEFVADTVTLNIDGLFQKPVSVSFSKDTVQPGEPVDVIVKAEEGSLVYLLSNDKSVQLLKSGNDLTQDLVREELESYQYGQYYPWMRYAFICGWPYYPSSVDVASVFRAAKTIMLTDGWVYMQESALDDRFYLFETDEGASLPEAAVPKAEAPASNGEVRKNFPENWLWNSHLVNSNGQVVISVNAPDTITSWVTSVFSVHPDYGLSVGLESVELTTFKDFFISLDLPLSITQGEEYCFTSSVFSYHPNPAMTLLTMQQSDDFDFLKVTRMNAGPVAMGTKGSHSISLGELMENDAESAIFCIKPKVIGQTPVQIRAITDIEGVNDAVERIINVKAEGVPRTTTRPYLLDMSNGLWEQNIDISFPVDTVPGSESITFIATGNLLAPVLENIGDLLRQPYGCGEQNMINFVPNIYLVDFLFKTNRLDAKTQEKAKGYMLRGYTTELTYEHKKTGGFSTFGDRDKYPSLWLTAFVTKAFSQAEKLNVYLEMLSIDPEIIARSVKFMMREQNKNGSFTERGIVFNKRLQGGSAEGEALVAYTLISLQEALEVFQTQHPDEKLADKITDSIASATEFLESRLTYLWDPYDICISTYALHLVNSQRKEEFFNKMEGIAIIEDGLKYWRRRPDLTKPTYPWSRTQDALSIEMTAYALLATSLRGGDSAQVLPVVNWLTQQRGPNGGFHSTQDTVTALQALTVVSVQQNIGEFIPLTITLSYNDPNGNALTETITVDKESELLLQHIYIPYDATTSRPSQLNIRGETSNNILGSSSTMAEVVLEYNVKSEATAPVYAMSHELMEIKGGFELTIKLRTVQGDFASMSILQVDIPAGFKASVHDNQNVSRVEISKDAETLSVYFTSDVIGPSGVVVVITMNGDTDGNVLASSTDKFYGVYNYYEKDFEVRQKYSINKNQGLCTSVPNFSICPATVLT